MIKNGELKPGDKLDSVQALAESFQVSRSAVREALSALKAMGLVEMNEAGDQGTGMGASRSLLSSAHHQGNQRLPKNDLFRAGSPDWMF